MPTVHYSVFTCPLGWLARAPASAWLRPGLVQTSGSSKQILTRVYHPVDKRTEDRPLRQSGGGGVSDNIAMEADLRLLIIIADMLAVNQT